MAERRQGRRRRDDPDETFDRRSGTERRQTAHGPFTLDQGARTRVAGRRVEDMTLLTAAARRRGGTVQGGAGSPTYTIQANAIRFAVDSGSTLCMSGFPLQQGQLDPANLTTVRLMKAGVEQAIYVESTGALWPDGTLRSVLLQYDAGTLNYGEPVALTFEVGVTSTVARATKDTNTYDPVGWAGTFKGAVIPTSATHLCASEVWLGFGPLQTQDQIDGATGWVDTKYGQFVDYCDRVWFQYEEKTGQYAGGASSYDGMVLFTQLWCQTGNWKWYQRACEAGESYFDLYSPSAPPDYHCRPHSMAVAYLITGEVKYRTFLVTLEDRLIAQLRDQAWDNPDNGYWIGGPIGDNRPHAMGLQATMFVSITGATSTGAETPNTASDMLDDLLAGFSTSVGQFGGTYYSKTSAGTGGCWVNHGGVIYRPVNITHTATSATEPGVGANWTDEWYATTLPVGDNTAWTTWVNGRTYYPGCKAYMVGMLMKALGQYYRHYNADARVPGVLKAAVDHLWANDWRAGDVAFAYVTHNGTTSGDTSTATGLLQGFMLAGWGLAYNLGYGGSYLTNGDTIAGQIGKDTSYWSTSSTQWQEAYFTFPEYLALRGVNGTGSTWGGDGAALLTGAYPAADKFKDTFTDTGGTTLASHTPEVGTWSKRTAGANAKIDGRGKYLNNSAGYDPGVYIDYDCVPGSALGANHDVQFDLYRDHVTATHNWRVWVRRASGNGGYFLQCDSSDGTDQWSYRPYEQSSGGTNTAIAAAVTVSCKHGEGNRIKITVRGNDYEVFVNGVSKFTWTDVTWAAESIVSVGQANTAANNPGWGCYMDNLFITDVA